MGTDTVRRGKNGTCGTLRECFTLAAQVSAAGRCSIPHLPCTFMHGWWSCTETSRVFPGLAHKALYASLYKWSCPVPSLFFPVLPHRIMWHKWAAARKSLLFIRAAWMCSAAGRLVFPGTGSGSPWEPCARHSCIHLIPEHGIVLPALELGEIKQWGVWWTQ